MPTAFCPGHITCFFQPAGSVEDDPLSRGSRGAGIRTSLGAYVTLEERSDDKVRFIMDGVDTDASVSRSVLEQMLPGRGFDVTIDNDLPCSEGFGMSAAGAIALALCASEYTGSDMQEVYGYAHRAEIAGGGGLGDVSALTCLVHQPVRVVQGLPPYGKVVGTDISFPRLSLAVLGPKMRTGNILGIPERYAAIVDAGKRAVDSFVGDPSLESLFALSDVFSMEAGVRSDEVESVIRNSKEKGARVGMCMLGNSVFSDAPVDVLEEVIGGDVEVVSCSSTDMGPYLIRKE
ncbi:MAG: pantothenate kinase [archaeon]|nr:pantothenate kinase [archaeon]